MTATILSFISGIATFMALDYVWLAIIAKSFYLKELSTHVRIENGSLVPYLPAVPLVYLVAAIAVSVFVLPHATTLREAGLYGTLLGFLMYAFYDLTNLATLTGYSWKLTLLDSLWGAVVVGVVAAVMFLARNALA